VNASSRVAIVLDHNASERFNLQLPRFAKYNASEAVGPNQ